MNHYVGKCLAQLHDQEEVKNLLEIGAFKLRLALY